MDYPVWEVAVGGGVLMAVVAIAHVIVSHFAIGGGLLLAVTETLSVRRGDRDLRELARRGSLMLILVSTVFGAVSGVGIWVVAGLISPGAISALIHTYVWGWAIEWTFFVVEIVAALVYYTTWGRISKAAHLMVGWIYFAAAYLSLVVINGIVTFMLTPGRWLETRAFWDGFFNPTYWPGLLLRTGICAVMATVFLLFTAQRADSGARPRLIRYLGAWLVAGGLVSLAGYLWWEAALPEPVLALFRGDSPLLESLVSTRALMLASLAATLLLGLGVFVAMPRAGRLPAALLVAVAAFTFFGSYERLREGSRKPFLIHSHLFSNGLRIDDIEDLNAGGLAARSGWVAARTGHGEIALGREIFKVQCSSCHTLDGYQGIRALLPTSGDLLAMALDEPEGSGERVFRSECASCHPDVTYQDMKETIPDATSLRQDPGFGREMSLMMINGTLAKLHDMGEFYAGSDTSAVVDTRQAAYPLMPPLVGTAAEVEALAAYLASLEDGDAEAVSLASRGSEPRGGGR